MNNGMTDKERVLMTILNRLSLTQTLCHNAVRESQFVDSSGDAYVHFGAYDDKKVEKGDLVLCETTGIHSFKIGFVHDVISMDTCVIREIGTNRICSVSNERFRRIVGLHKSEILEGEEYVFQEKARMAFHRGDEYWYRFGGVDFLENKTVRIWIREAFGGMNKPSVPFSFTMKWDKRTSVKKILGEMRLNGYGIRKFELVEEKKVSET